MTLEDIEINQELICTKLTPDAGFEPSVNREVGHIGRVRGIYHMEGAVLIGHIENVEHSESGYAEFLTPFLVEELDVYEAPEKSLQLAIQKTLVNITREK